MNILVKNLTHHAYAIIYGSDLASVKSSLVKSLNRLKVNTVGNPDFFEREYDSFTIDNAREVKSFHQTRPVSETGKKCFILSMNNITVEAQNALLKLLEEPGDYAHFFILIPSAHLLLPTVKSRLEVIRARAEMCEADSGENLNAGFADAGKFLKLTQQMKLEYIKNLLDDISKDRKSKQDAVDFFNRIEKIFYEEKGPKKGRETLEAMALARMYINDRSPSFKMLLEYVALKV